MKIDENLSPVAEQEEPLKEFEEISKPQRRKASVQVNPPKIRTQPISQVSNSSETEPLIS